MPEITDAMVDAAREEWRKHAANVHEEAGGTWTWDCNCGAFESKPHRTSGEAGDEADRHEFRATVEAALATAPKPVDATPIDAALAAIAELEQVRAERDELRARLDQADELLARSQPILTAVSGMPAVLDSWPQWWCPTCGTRYANETVHDGLCGDGHELQPVTLQLVTRSAE